MKRTGIVRGGICLAMFGMLALHCANPFLPGITITPEDGSVFVADGTPYPLAVGVSVPVPGCGATTFPVIPASFGAELIPVLDGELGLPTDITSLLGTPEEDLVTGTLTWSSTVPLPDFGEYMVAATISNDQGPVTRARDFRLEQTVSLFPGAYQAEMTITNMTQKDGCFTNALVWAAVRGIAGTQTLYLDLPSGAEIAAAPPPGEPLDIVLPGLGTVPVNLTLGGDNDILMAGPVQGDDYKLDLYGLGGQFGIEGFDCELWISATGVFDDIDPDDLDGSLTVTIHGVEDSPQGGTCNPAIIYDPPPGGCDLIVDLDMDP